MNQPSSIETQVELLQAVLPPDQLQDHRESAFEAPAPGNSVPLWLPIRELHEGHRPRVLQHLLALSPDDRRLRFGHAAGDVQVAAYAAGLDFDRDEFFGVFDSRLTLVAMTHLAFDAQHHLAEFGVSVHAHQRGRGIGARLFERAVTEARNRGAHTMAIHLARDNAPMLAIVRRSGAQLVFDGAEALAQLELPSRTLVTQVEALVENEVAKIDYRIKMQLLRLDRNQPSETS